MAKPSKVYRVTEPGKPGASGKFQWFDTLQEVQSAYPDLTGLKIKKFKLHEEKAKDVDPAQPEEDDDEEDDEPEPTPLPA